MNYHPPIAFPQTKVIINGKDDDGNNNDRKTRNPKLLKIHECFFLAKIELLSKLLFLTINDATNGQIVAWQVVVLIYFCPPEKYTFYSMSDYRFEQLDISEKGIRETSQLLTLVFGESAKLTPEYIHWEYNQNPAGKALGFDAWMEDVQAALT